MRTLKIAHRLNKNWSIRMRGEKSAVIRGFSQGGLCPPCASIHITGAEGLYENDELLRVVKSYTLRALTHSRGIPDKIVITIERLKKRPKALKALPVQTLKCESSSYAIKAVRRILKKHGISESAIKTAFRVLKNRDIMRGAAIIDKDKGLRLEPDKTRGVRVSRMGIRKPILKNLSKRLSRFMLNTDTVREALILASKVASSPYVIAEVCISDDPDYTTGYIAGKMLGYLRIPNIKEKNSNWGGRVFFVNDDIDINELTDYLEESPVIIEKLSEIRGMVTLNEILSMLNISASMSLCQ